MKKRWTSLVLALALALSMAVPALAAQASMDNFTDRYTYTSGQFTDVPAGAWYESALKDCFESGLMNGKTATTFDPKGNLTIAQAMVMSARLHDIYHGGTGVLPAAAAGEAWYKPAYTYLFQKSLLGKTDLAYLSSGNYNDPATREDMAFFFARVLPAASYNQINTVENIPDVDRKKGNGGFIYELYEQGVLTGSDIYGTYRPNDNVTRAEAAAIIARVAFPEQRKTLDLHEKYTVGSTVFAMPVGSETYTEDAFVEVTHDEKLADTLVYTDTDPELEGMSILLMTEEDVADMLYEIWGEAGVSKADFDIGVAQFGSVVAYRAIFAVEGLPCCTYYYISGDTLYSYQVMTADVDRLITLANSVTVNGAAVSPKLA